MKPVFQRGRLDCFSACLASIFELPLEAVPNFWETHGAEGAAWWSGVHEWLGTLGYGCVTVDLPPSQGVPSMDGYIIVAGSLPNMAGALHATIWSNGKMIHDPMPGSPGLDMTGKLQVDILYPLDPARFILWAGDR